MKDITYSKYNTHIKDSYQITNEQIMMEYIRWIIEVRKTMKFPTRTETSYLREWIGHNRLYKWGIARGRTGSVDLNENQNIFEKLVWLIIGR